MNILIYRTLQLPDHIINKIMTVVNHPVVDMINEGLTINNELFLRIVKDDTKMWFRANNKELRRQELDKNK